jgi:hypothetical protein
MAEPRRPLAARIAWFIALWAAGVVAVAAVAFLVRFALGGG